MESQDLEEVELLQEHEKLNEMLTTLKDMNYSVSTLIEINKTVVQRQLRLESMVDTGGAGISTVREAGTGESTDDDVSGPVSQKSKMDRRVPEITPVQAVPGPSTTRSKMDRRVPEVTSVQDVLGPAVQRSKVDRRVPALGSGQTATYIQTMIFEASKPGPGLNSARTRGSIRRTYGAPKTRRQAKLAESKLKQWASLAAREGSCTSEGAGWAAPVPKDAGGQEPSTSEGAVPAPREPGRQEPSTSEGAGWAVPAPKEADRQEPSTPEEAWWAALVPQELGTQATVKLAIRQYTACLAVRQLPRPTSEVDQPHGLTYSRLVAVVKTGVRSSTSGPPSLDDVREALNLSDVELSDRELLSLERIRRVLKKQEEKKLMYINLIFSGEENC
ncbi:uncharacterized protein LOC131948955 [Physella acuta]|uniref:uncharacterized protein LOC131948955 n=1 Tax=Physella acuta TaxID=109671 RepID=UPI0027DE7694|nr:uncharacterized protein LOC131948955 [Physella acuta]